MKGPTEVKGLTDVKFKHGVGQKFLMLKGWKEMSGGRDIGGCSLKCSFMVGFTKVLGASFRLAPALLGTTQ